MNWWVILSLLALICLVGAIAVEAYYKRGKYRPLASKKPSARDVAFERHRATTVVTDFKAGRQLYKTPAHLKIRMLMEDEEALEQVRLRDKRTSDDQLQEKRNRIRPWDNT